MEIKVINLPWDLYKIIMNEHYLTDQEAHNKFWLGYVPFTSKDLLKYSFNSASGELSNIFDIKGLFNNMLIY